MSEAKLDEIAESRNVNAAFHFREGRKWLALSQKGHRTTPLAYCAFEFRLSLERVAFELLFQIRGSSFDENDLKASKKVKNIQNRIHDLEGNQLQLDRKFTFLRILLELAGNKRFKLAHVNLSILKKHWQFCSEYCHMQFSLPTSWGDSAFVEAAYKGLCDVSEFLTDINSSLLVWPKWEDAWITNLLNDFVDGKIDESVLISELKKKGVWGLFEAPDGKKTFLSDL